MLKKTEEACVHLWLREAYSFLSGVLERLTDLDPPQEEVDTRLLSHAAHTARSKFVAVISCPKIQMYW